MIKIENGKVYGWEAAVEGMRNPLNSWDKSDSFYCDESDCYIIGENDMKLMKALIKGGADERKFLRFLTVTATITAPLYWWKEYDTYKVGTVANSCSTMHKIADKEFTLDDFSHEHLISNWIDYNCESFIYGEIDEIYSPKNVLEFTIRSLNVNREAFLNTKDKHFWWQMIQLLPTSYNQKRTVQLNYEVLRNIYHARKNHKLDEWRAFCKWIETLPYAKELVCE